MLDLYGAGILRRRGYDYLSLQRALAANGSNSHVDENALEALLAGGAAGAGRGRRGRAAGGRRVPPGNAIRSRLPHLASSRPMTTGCRPIWR